MEVDMCEHTIAIHQLFLFWINSSGDSNTFLDEQRIRIAMNIWAKDINMNMNKTGSGSTISSNSGLCLCSPSLQQGPSIALLGRDQPVPPRMQPVNGTESEETVVTSETRNRLPSQTKQQNNFS